MIPVSMFMDTSFGDTSLMALLKGLKYLSVCSDSFQLWFKIYVIILAKNGECVKKCCFTFNFDESIQY